MKPIKVVSGAPRGRSASVRESGSTRSDSEPSVQKKRDAQKVKIHF